MKKYKKYFIITLMLAFVFSFSFTYRFQLHQNMEHMVEEHITILYQKLRILELKKEVKLLASI